MYVQGTSGSNLLGSVSQPPKVEAVIDLNKTLTPDDKLVIKAATGHDIGTQRGANGNFVVPRLAVAIAISRQTGALEGPITKDFLTKYNAEVGKNIIQNAINFIEENQKTAKGRSINLIDITA